MITTTVIRPYLVSEIILYIMITYLYVVAHLPTKYKHTATMSNLIFFRISPDFYFFAGDKNYLQVQ